MTATVSDKTSASSIYSIGEPVQSGESSTSIQFQLRSSHGSRRGSMASLPQQANATPRRSLRKVMLIVGLVALYRVPEIVTRGRFPDGGESDSTWRTQEARHVGSDTIAPGF